MWWAIVELMAISSPSWKTGQNSVKSEVCAQPRYGSLQIRMSPGRHYAVGIAFRTPSSAVDMVPSWAGMVSDCASISPSAVKIAQE